MPEDFKTRLKTLRTQKKMTQEDLSKVLDIPDSTIRRYETDGGVPKRERLALIADYFDVDIDYLLGRSDNPSRKNTDENTVHIDPFLIFELVDKFSDEEIIEKYKHMAQQKDLDEKIIRNHLQHIRLLKSLKS